MQVFLTQKSDIEGVAACHRKAFPDSISSKLQASISIKLLSWYLDNPRGVLFHVEENGQIIGYCGAIKTNSPDLEGSSTSMTQYSFKVLLIALASRPWLLFHRDNLKRIPFITRNILLKLGIEKKNDIKINYQEKFVPFWGLVVIGVDSDSQGKGIGSILINEFEKLAKEDGVEKIFLSVKKENAKAIKSYLYNNWEIKSRDYDSFTMYKNI
ncbi:MAG: GNAT family N-acetyltransferase [Chitinophagaceae bacterium]|jgi:ribosomal protein S18 acetylase RimI-like enzyme|nr:GNAT family N-acetyltransferase [Chitinophagaceae bacterium]